MSTPAPSRFQKFLAWLDPDQDRAAELYERTSIALIFVCRKSRAPWQGFNLAQLGSLDRCSQYQCSNTLEVLVGSPAAEVVNKVEWPGTADTDRVDFRVPNATTPGMTTVQISSASVAGTEVRVPVR